MSRITCGKLTSHPSAFRRGVNKRCACGHHHQRVQIDRLAIFPKTTLEDQLPSLSGKFPSPECPECYKNWPIVFEEMWKRSTVGVFAIKVHLIRIPE